MDKFQKFIPLTKVEEQADGTLHVFGLVTAEQPDRDKEVCDYSKTVPYYKKTVDEMLKATDVPGMESSIMPLREMHQLNAVGKGISIQFDDVAKAINMGFEVVAPETIKKVKKGVLPAFSQGGNYVEKWADPKFEGCTRYVADPGEVSLVDRGSLPAAVIQSMKGQSFALVKANGSMELVKYDVADAAKFSEADAALISAALRKTLEESGLAKEAKTKRKGGKDLPASAFAYVGDPEDTSTWKLPIHDAAHARNALARFNQTQGIPAEERGKVKAKIRAAAKKFGIDVAGEAEKIARAVAYLKSMNGGPALAKGMWDVGNFAGVLETINWMRESSTWEREAEGDSSTVPEDLAQLLEDAILCFTSMVEEETSELQERAAAASGKGAKAMTQEELTKIATALEKRTKSVQAHLQSLHDMHSTHHDAMHKAHTSHRDAAHAVIAKCNKALGGEDESQDVSGSGPDSASITVDPSGTGAHSVKASDLADMEKRMTEKTAELVTEGIAAFMKGFFGKDDDSATAAPVAKAAPGIGDRNLTLANILGPAAAATAPISKTAEQLAAGASATPAATALTPEDVMKAGKGDPEAMLKLARSIKPMTAADAQRATESFAISGARR